MAAPPPTPAPSPEYVARVRRLAAVGLILGISVCAAFLLTPSRFTPSIPGDEALGLVSTRTIKANRDYDVRDPETTEKKREEAARSVWPVYDFNAASGETLKQRISSAFAAGRAAVDAWKRENLYDTTAHLEAVRAEQARTANGTPAPRKALRAAPEEAKLLKALEASRDEFVKALQAIVDPADFQELARARFDPPIETAALRLAAFVTNGYIIEDRLLIAAEREHGITVRNVAGPPQLGGEDRVRDIDRIRDLEQVRADVDRAAPEQLAELPQPLRRTVAELVKRALRPNLAYDDSETRHRQSEKRDAVKDVVLQIKKGEKIIGDGELVTPTHLIIFHALRAQGRSAETEQVRWGGALFAAIVCAALFQFGRRNVRKFRLRSRDGILLAAVLVGQLLLVRGGLALADEVHDLWSFIPADFASAMVPIAGGSLLVRFLLTSEASLIWTVAYAPLCGLLAGGSLQAAVVAVVAGVVGADRVAHAGSRGAIFKAGLWSGVAHALVVLAFALFGGRVFSMDTGVGMAGALLGGGLVVPAFTILAAPLLEATFGYVTDIRLLQLASFNNPVLKDLIVQAPGTYHHSIVIGSLVDAAAKEIHANPLLARVGAYYHDIGKGKNPLYFGENQKGENRHDQLTPQMSAMLIRRHVQDGLELAKAKKLPKPVSDFIPQHHGTRLVGYFYHRAREEAERLGQPPPAESDFRYSGPKPQSREAALVMVADMVVATTRSLSDATPEALRQLVDRALQAAVADGQLVECDLTLRDLDLVAQSFVRTLLAIYQARAGDPGSLQPRAVLRVLGPETPAPAAVEARRA
jgi:putative nucleotidyltransferase with HDIG domain